MDIIDCFVLARAILTTSGTPIWHTLMGIDAPIDPEVSSGTESLDVTLACLKGKDAESEEAQEHANSSSLALYA
jgi:hypothetical protein